MAAGLVFVPRSDNRVCSSAMVISDRSATQRRRSASCAANGETL